MCAPFHIYIDDFKFVTTPNVSVSGIGVARGFNGSHASSPIFTSDMSRPTMTLSSKKAKLFPAYDAILRKTVFFF